MADWNRLRFYEVSMQIVNATGIEQSYLKCGHLAVDFR